MLRNVRIKGFRGIESVELNSLRGINVLIGENNSGKTSILEAIQLLENDNVIANLYSIACKRENMVPLLRSRATLVDTLLYCFYDMQKLSMLIDAEDTSGRKIYAEIEGEKYAYIEEEDGYQLSVLPEEKSGLRGEFRYNGSYHFRHESFQVDDKNRIILKSSDNVIPMEYLSPITIQSQYTSIKTMYNVMRGGEREALIELLQIFDSRIVGIDKAVRSGRAINFLELQNGEMMPLSVFGDGVKKVLAIANALIRAKGGIVLIDEFETGIHKNALRKVADWLFQAAEKNGTQVFLTTHSSEAIDALIDKKANWENMNMYRLEQFNGRTYVKTFAGEDLNDYRNKWGMDVF